MASGKTWCADYLESKHRYKKVAFAAKLKELARELYGIETKAGINRTILQRLGSDLRKYDPDVWIKYTLRNIHEIETEREWSPRIVLDDLRYVNEAIMLRNNGFVLIQVYTPEPERQDRITALYPSLPPRAITHASEQEWQAIVADYIVESSGFKVTIQLDNILEGIQRSATG